MRLALIAAAVLMTGFHAQAEDVKFAPTDAKKPYLMDALKDKSIRAPVVALITREELPHWAKGIIKNRNYTAQPVLTTISPLPGTDVYNACEAHNCSDNRISILITPHKHHAYALLKEGKTLRFVGGPKAQQQAILSAAMGK
ncbi:Ivy family c-type lysozyme inhibitor [Rhizobium sp. C4]|uniref:Ivy family c-type lysozyme inhibitor n=1 Tax=Rhizobium sp. C4 TaxID=1349800 RepID=UPI001E2E42BC|nr:Ivy family c-type lysozyme inhibitor [Rhizobium sp. C4]MCD2175931.1 inhibitor of vertebrate lysozyme family protein [Rhizobium sp. C4]